MAEQSKQLRQALLAIKQLRSRLESVEQVRTEPIAIIGLGCRFPGGAGSPESFWRLLKDGVDAVTEVPADRWEPNAFYDPDVTAPGKMNSRWGAFLDRVDEFDPEFFGIAPREASYMDPQQRLLLEVAFETLEDAGQSLETLAGSPTGIFVGIHSHSNDYAWFQLGQMEGIDTHTATGTAHSIVANRLSYCFDLRGPSLAVDTACSSSLVAVHLACESLRNGECTLALAGGVNLMLSPEASVTFSKLHMLASDGRCKTFDAGADGFVRGEGCGLVALKRLSDARADGDPILALIVGSAVNQDGRTNGLTAPNGRAQQAVIRRAIAAARIDPGQIGYVEVHGTGTALGDPIEVEALAEVLGYVKNSSEPCFLGSVKSNIGHLEAAAGIAGLIKTTLALKHRLIPRSLHYQELNPHITLEGTRLAIADSEQPWSADKPRYAGVSSFGFGGTNAHIILQGVVPTPDLPLSGEEDLDRKVALLPLSAHSERALHDLVRKYRQFLVAEPISMHDLCYTLSRRRTHHEYRLAIEATSRSDLIDRLDAFLGGVRHPDVLTGRRLQESRRALFFAFSGQGPQWPGMGRTLLETEPRFSAKIEEIDNLLKQFAGWSLIEALTAGEAHSRLHETEIAQPSLFALQVALSDLWQSWGVTPDAVVGHSSGEIAAAHVAGILSLHDAVRVIWHRARLMQQASGLGRMVAVALSLAEAEALLPAHQGRVSIAAVNGPSSTVLSGNPEDIEAIASSLQARGIFARLLPGRYAFHSDQMAPFQEALVQALEGIELQPGNLPIYSTVTGVLATGQDFGPAYWGRNIREPVRFADTISTLLASGYDHCVEISPHPVLAHSILDCAGTSNQTLVLPSLRRNEVESDVLKRGLGALYSRGYPIRWDRLYPSGRILEQLPTYPWQRRRYWLKTPAPRRSFDGSGGRTGHPLLSHRLRTALPLFESQFDLERLPYLRDHRLYDRSILPATVYIEMALAVADALPVAGTPQLTNLTIQEPLPLPEEGARTVQLTLLSRTDRSATFQIWSQDDREENRWTLHASGTIFKEPITRANAEPVSMANLMERCQEVPVTDHYRRLKARGFHFGAAFQGIEQLWLGEDEALAKVHLPVQLAAEMPRYQIHPALLDACLQPVLALLPEQDSHILVGFDRLQIHTVIRDELWSHVEILPFTGESSTVRGGDVHLYDQQGQLVAEITGLILQPGEAGGRRTSMQANDALETWLYEVTWQEAPLEEEETSIGRILSPCQLAEQLFSRPGTGQLRDGSKGNRESVPPLDRLCVGYVLQAFTDLAWSWKVGQFIQRDALAGTLGVQDRYHRLLGRMLALLEAEGILRAVPPGWEVVQAPILPEDIHAEWSELRERDPRWATELDLLGRCGPNLAAVMRGDIEPLDLLFPQGRLDTVEPLYQNSAFVGPMNRLVGATVKNIVEGLSEDQTFRILEIGAGTGGTTAHILPHLPAERTQYLFTDLSPLFLKQAEEKFRDYPFVRFAQLDIEKGPAGQNMESHGFDLILAANVLHATADLRQSLDHVRQLLAPGGLLILPEVTRPGWWLDLTFGLTEGWWKFTDTEIRPHHPLLSAAAWIDLLRSTEFTEVAALPAADSEAAASQTLLLAGEPSEQERSGQWLLFADQGGVAAELAAHLQSRDEDVTLVVAGDRYNATNRTNPVIDPSRPEHFRRLMEMLSRTGRQPQSIIYLWGLDLTLSEESSPDSLEYGQARVTGALLHLVQALLDLDVAESSRLWIGTYGTQPVEDTNGARRREASTVAQATLWGFGRVLALEHPELVTKLVDLDNSAIDEQAAVLFQEVWSRHAAEEDQVAWRNGKRYVPRLQRNHTVPTEPASWRGDGSYLITGGLGGLGLTVARWLAEEGVSHLVLAGRTPLPDRSLWGDLAPESEIGRRVAAVQAIESAGASVEVVSADVSDEQQMRALFDRFNRDLPPLRGIFHAAATIDNTLLSKLTIHDLLGMFRAKVVGSWLLHQLSRDLDLDCFILFSSTTALWGVSGMAHYAAANCFLDAMAFYRQALGLPAVSINWGLWESARVLSDEEVTSASQMGLQAMPDSQALDALGRLARAGHPQQVVAGIDWDRLKPVYEAKGKRPFFSRLDRRPAPGTGVTSVPLDDINDRLKAVPTENRYELLLDFVRGQVSHILGYDDAQPIDIQRGLFTMGMDSLMAVQLKARLETLIGESLPTTLTFNYPNIAAIAAYLAERFERVVAIPGASERSSSDEGEPATTGTDSPGGESLLTQFDEELDRIDNSLKEN